MKKLREWIKRINKKDNKQPENNQTNEVNVNDTLTNENQAVSNTNVCDMQEKKEQSQNEKTNQVKTKKECFANDEFGQLLNDHLDMLNIGDVESVDILQKDGDGYIGVCKRTSQEIIILKSEVEQDLKPGDSVKCKIYKIRNDEIYGSQIQLKNPYWESKKTKNVFNKDQIYSGKVSAFHDPFFKVYINGTLFSVLKYRIDVPPILDYESYIGKTLDFEIQNFSKNEKTNETYIEWSRKRLALEHRENAIANYQEGDLITIDNGIVNNGGLESVYKLCRVFIPSDLILSNGRANKDNILNILTFPLELKVISKSNDTLICDLAQPVKDQFDEFVANHAIGDEIEVRIAKILDTGVLGQVNAFVRGVIYFDDPNNHDQLLEKLAVDDKLKVKLKKIDTENKRLKFTLETNEI